MPDLCSSDCCRGVARTDRAIARALEEVRASNKRSRAIIDHELPAIREDYREIFEKDSHHG